MRVGHFRKLPMTGAAALALSACGGGGTIGTNSALPPPATPASPLAPASNLAVVPIFSPPPSDGFLAVVGFEAPGDNSVKLTSTGFSVSYDALFERYLIKVPAMPSGYFYRRSASDVDPGWLIGTLATLDKSGEHGAVDVLKPSNPELQLTYTTLAGYNGSDGQGVPFGWFAFGAATRTGAVPVTGSAAYSALVRGASVERNATVEGLAALQFDFGAGTLSGHMDPILHDPTGLGFNDTPLGRYEFVNTIYGSGSTTFSGQLSNPALTGLGSFNGLFTGPSGEELMARWSAPYQFPGISGIQQMFGVLVGKRK